MTIRVGFIISHPFQYQFYAPIAEKLTEPVFVLEGRVKTPFTFSDDFIAQLNGSVVRLDTSELLAVDGLIDVVFCMTPVHVLKLFKSTKVVALQYSMAKEVYQYGPWRLVADLNMMQGRYSHDRISGFCASEIVGNPRYDGCSSLEIGGGGMLYMPTYGDLSSLPHFIEALPTLPEDLGIRVKLHHGSEFKDTKLVDRLRSDPRVVLIDGYANALEDIARADVVVSDYSGAIFDALYLDRPIALLQPPVEQEIIRTDAESIEIARAQDIGPIARSADELYAAIQSATADKGKWEKSREALRREIYAYEGNSAERVIEALKDLMEGKYDPPSVKRELRDTYIRYLRGSRQLKAAIKTRPKKIQDKTRNLQDKRGKIPLYKRVEKFFYRNFKRYVLHR
jgi:Putative glycosyl/glycerophosphate transferases involved in teichoic acid biosynthesis TagF/TagB/EpsJ/RodC